MRTIKVTPFTKFRNLFTNDGREINNMIKDLALPKHGTLYQRKFRNGNLGFLYETGNQNTKTGIVGFINPESSNYQIKTFSNTYINKDNKQKLITHYSESKLLVRWVKFVEKLKSKFATFTDDGATVVKVQMDAEQGGKVNISGQSKNFTTLKSEVNYQVNKLIGLEPHKCVTSERTLPNGYIEYKESYPYGDIAENRNSSLR